MVLVYLSARATASVEATVRRGLFRLLALTEQGAHLCLLHSPRRSVFVVKNKRRKA